MPEIFINLGGTSSSWWNPQDNSKKDDTKKDDTQKNDTKLNDNDLLNIGLPTSVEDNSKLTSDLFESTVSLEIDTIDKTTSDVETELQAKPETILFWAKNTIETPISIEATTADTVLPIEEVKSEAIIPESVILEEPKISETTTIEETKPIENTVEAPISIETPTTDTVLPIEEVKSQVIMPESVILEETKISETTSTIEEAKPIENTIEAPISIESTTADTVLPIENTFSQDIKKDEKKPIFGIFGKKDEVKKDVVIDETAPKEEPKKEQKKPLFGMFGKKDEAKKDVVVDETAPKEEPKKEQKKPLFGMFGKKDEAKKDVVNNNEIADLLSEVSLESKKEIIPETPAPQPVPEAVVPEQSIIPEEPKKDNNVNPLWWAFSINLWGSPKKEEETKAVPTVNTFKISVWAEEPKKDDKKTEDLFKTGSSGVMLEWQKTKEASSPVINILNDISKNWLFLDGDIDDNIQKEIFKKAQKKKQMKKMTNVTFVSLTALIVLGWWSYYWYQNKDNLASILGGKAAMWSWDTAKANDKSKELEQKNDELTKKIAEIWTWSSPEMKAKVEKYEKDIEWLKSQIAQAEEIKKSMTEKEAEIKSLSQKNSELQQKLTSSWWGSEKVAQLQKQLKEKNDLILKFQSWNGSNLSGVAMLSWGEIEQLLMEDFYNLYKNDFTYIKNSKIANTQKYLIMLNDSILNYQTKKYNYKTFRMTYESIMINFFKEMK